MPYSSVRGPRGATPPNPVIDWNSLTDGTVTWNTTLLPGGTYKVVAHYEGDTTYGGSYSAPSASVTVNPENSTVIMPGVVTGVNQITGLPTYSNSVVYGTGAFDLYLLRADVYNAQNAQCTTSIFGFVACPTGTIGFTDSVNGGSPNPPDASPYTLNSLGYTEDQAVQLTGGVHTLSRITAAIIVTTKARPPLPSPSLRRRPLSATSLPIRAR